MCKLCRETSEKDICDDCQKSIERGYEISSLAGRCANGAERDSGFRFHARMLDENQYPSLAALCGYSPGRRSAGWSSWKPADRAVTCPRCAKRLEKMKDQVGSGESA